MSEKNSPLAGGQEAKRKPIIHYAGNEKIINPYLIQGEKIILVNALAYGYFPQRYVFNDSRHKLIFSYLEGFCWAWPEDQWCCEFFIDYLNDASGALARCGGAEYVRGIFRGIGEAA